MSSNPTPRKAHPKCRWHLSVEEKRQIAKLSAQGRSQTDIARAMHITRPTVELNLKKLGLPTRVPLLHQEKILALLTKGVERRKIARSLGVSYRKVYAFAREHGFARAKRQPLSSERMAWLCDDVANRRGSAASLAKKYSVPYKLVLQLAHSMLECERFLPIRQPPLSSYFPMKDLRRRKVKSIHE